jgi:hypothetical protein
MKQFSVRVNDELYQKAHTVAQEAGVSLSDFVRDAVVQACDSGGATEIATPEILNLLRDELHTLRDELSTKNSQLDRKETQLEQLQADNSEQSKRHDMIVAQMTQQLERANLQLEDMRQRPSFWQRLVGRADKTQTVRSAAESR